MFKKLIGVILCLSTLCLLLVGCGKTDLEKSADYMEDHPLEETKLYTISFCLVTDEAIEASALSEMQLQFNEYSETNYNIRVEFINKTVSEYASWLNTKLDEASASHKAKLAEEAKAAESTTETTEAVTTSSSGNLGSDVRNVYPELADDQIDIIYIADYDMLRSLVMKGYLRDLTTELSSLDYRLIKSNMTENFFLNAKVGGKVYGVPNCRIMADYNYLLVDAEKASYYNFVEESFTDYASTANLRAWLTNDGADVDTFVKKDVSGSYADRVALAEDGKYWVYSSNVEQMPTIDQTALMNSMLAISSFAYVDDGGTKLTDTDDYCPAVKILYEINSNKDLHSILQYGARGTTYTVTKESTVELVSGTEMKYSVDAKYTGNIFSLYPLTADAEKVDNWKLQNRETVIVSSIKNVSISSSDSKLGSVSADVDFGKVGETCKLTATVLEGTSFAGWKHSVSDNEFLSTDATYSITITDSDNTYIAIFN